ncbi:XRE family transcriptional regulator [Profundibacterium mesophilum]|uniref:Transcriptional reguator n=1 Tax=Profundibacterium mesophilum KAUST100406-0324 TaxID=1037889 RepID=A0A921NWU7_9RHOB|nr:XRE family transcriptional regulator [Profundibacterium mesophilum]KAF0675008.1 putative transcriptional reguator [Profundibacterium mesophilum KAUST100406-0324]
MARSIPVGARLRARRLDLEMTQAELARRLEISPSYLNLIEHDRRRIGGKLLARAADALGTDVASLSRGAAQGLVEALRLAAGMQRGDGREGEPASAGDHERAGPAGARALGGAELEAAEDFASRYPGWAGLVAAQDRRIAALERTAELLSDRLTHDPYLSAAIHDVLSAVTAIRSTAAILADEPDISTEWRTRFHRNLHDDSRRLAEGSQGLVDYLEGEGEAENAGAAPQQELEDWLSGRDYHIEELEPGAGPIEEDRLAARIGALASAREGFVTGAGRALGARWMHRYAADASALPLAPLRASLQAHGGDPGRIAQSLAAPLPLVLRRLACLPEGLAGRPAGLVICDGTGAMILRRPVAGFSVPRFGAACPLWPLYQVLLEPSGAMLRVIEQAGRMPQRFTAYAASQVRRTEGFGGPLVAEAVMLVLPAERGGKDEGAADAPGAIRAGTNCRICPREDCAARREASILGTGGPAA